MKKPKSKDMSPPKMRLILLNMSHIFNCEDKDILLNNIYKKEQLKSKIKLPFNVIFLDVNKEFTIKNEKFKINGLLISYAKGKKYIGDGEPITKIDKFISITCRLSDNKNSFSIYTQVSYPYDKLDGFLLKNKLVNKSIDKLYNLFQTEVNEINVIILSIFKNFINLLDNPEIELITTERSKEQNLKRIKRGKVPLPTIHNIKITGKLKIYLDKLKSNPDFNYTHRFDVRGHWRTLRSDKWKYKKGTKIWIANYIKGEGIYIKKNYEVKDEN